MITADLPAGWIKVQLGQVATFVMGQAPPGSECNITGRGTPFVKAGEFGLTRPIIREWTTKPLKMAVSSDVLICVVGATAGKLNLGAECAIGRSVAAIRPSPALDQDFLYLQLLPKVLELRAGSVGSAQGVISSKDLAAIELTLPPLAEQRRIVAALEEHLSDLDAAVGALERAKANLDRYTSSLLQATVFGKFSTLSSAETPSVGDLAAERRGSWEAEARRRSDAASRAARQYKDPTQVNDVEVDELTDLPPGWRWVTVDQIAWSVKDGPHFSPDYADSGVPFITGGQVRQWGVDFANAKHIAPELHRELSKRCRPEYGDILYTKGGTTGIARVNSYHHEFNVWVHVAVLKLIPSADPFFIQHALNSPWCRSQAQRYTHGVGNQDLGLTRMVKIVLPLPPLDAQRLISNEIEKRMSDVARMEREIELQLTRAARLRQSILKRAFEGKLVPQDPSDEPASALLARVRETSPEPAAAPRTRGVRPRPTTRSGHA